ncbi:MAG: hypothetical protein B7C24_17900 [Bacteroidetes bacterium 4572_77]|nr:MAG: hypothetical protein B7C24_17900 [Bacteroidetes bacterium 4572_77]
MKTNVTFRHTKGHHPELQAQALEYAEGFEKYFDGITSTNVEFMKETTGKEVKITTHVQGATMVAEAEGIDFATILHEASNKIVRQLKKHKTKLVDRKTKPIEI